MRRFSFRFEVVKRERRARLDAAQAVLAEILHRRQLAVDLLTERRQVLDMVCLRGPCQPFDARRETLRQRHISALHDELRRRHVQLTRLNEEADIGQEAVAEAHRGLRAMEILEEQDHERWRREFQRAEQAAADEQSAQRFGR